MGRLPLKTRHSTKVAIFESSLYKLRKGLVFQVRFIFSEGLVFYQMDNQDCYISINFPTRGLEWGPP